MAAVPGDERPASTLTESVLVSTAAQAFVMEEARAWAKLGELQCCTNVTEKEKKNSFQT